MLRQLWNLLNKDLTGRTSTRDVTHPYFGHMTRVGSKDSSTDYWEAELIVQDLGQPVSFTFRGNEHGPDAGEVAFARQVLGDLGALFEKCRAAFSPEFQKLTDTDLPDDWRRAFQLDGIGLPAAGNPGNAWDVCYFVKPAGRYFTGYFERNTLVRVSVDG